MVRIMQKRSWHNSPLTCLHPRTRIKTPRPAQHYCGLHIHTHSTDETFAANDTGPRFGHPNWCWMINRKTPGHFHSKQVHKQIRTPTLVLHLGGLNIHKHETPNSRMLSSCRMLAQPPRRFTPRPAGLESLEQTPAARHRPALLRKNRKVPKP